MGILSALAEIIRDLLIFVGAMAILLAALVLVISRLQGDNPLKRMLTALSYRVAASLVAGLIALPVEPIPGLDTAYDIGVPLLLIVYWLSFLGRIGRFSSKPSKV